MKIEERKTNSTLRGGIRDGKYVLEMSPAIDGLRREIWDVIHMHDKKGQLSSCDIAMAIGIIQYEHMHHVNDPTWRNPND